MKNKCNSLWTSIGIALVVLSMAVLFQYIEFPPTMYNAQNFCVVILISAVSGSLVAIIIFIDEYRNEKRSTLERYLSAAEDTVSTFRSLKYLFIKEPSELVKRYFDEAAHNTRAQQLCEQLKKSVDAEVKDVDTYTLQHSVRYEWGKLLEPGFVMLKEKMDPEKYQRMLDDAVERKAKEYIRQMDSVIDSYVDLFDQISFAKMDRIYGQIGFFTGKRHATKIYTKFNDPLRTKLNEIRRTIGGRFGVYKNGDDPSYSNVLQAILDVQQETFSTEVLEDKLGRVTLAYNDFYSDMCRLLEDFRASLYSIPPQYHDRYYLRSGLDTK